MSLPLVFLAIFSIFFGYLFKDLFVGIGSSFWNHSLFIHPDHSLLIETEFGLSSFVKLFILFFSLAGIISAFLLYFILSQKKNYLIFFSGLPNKFNRKLYNFLSNKWYYDRLYESLLDRSLNLGYISYKTLDKGIIELIGPSGLSKTMFSFSKNFTSFDTGYIPHYLFYIVLSFIFLIFFILFELDSKLILLFILIVFFLGSIHHHYSPL